jgi:pimeloyl-ACP methyl ester carboxylesterase
VVNVDQSLRLGDFATAVAPLEALLRDPATFRETLLAAFGDLPPSLDPRYVDYLEHLHRNARQAVVLGVWGQLFESSPEELQALAESLLGAITVPYVAIHGSDPGAGYADWLAALVPGATVELWDGDGHYPHLAEPARMAARIAAMP